MAKGFESPRRDSHYRSTEKVQGNVETLVRISDLPPLYGPVLTMHVLRISTSQFSAFRQVVKNVLHFYSSLAEHYDTPLMSGRFVLSVIC